MKTFNVLVLFILLLVACQNPSTRYIQNSEEIETVKAVINDYDFHKWDSQRARYADTAKIYYNSRVNILNPKDLKDYHLKNDTSFSTRAFEDEYREYEMIEDNNGKVWVNFWGLWKGHLVANNKEIVIPVHITYQFKNGKIVTEYGYWNTGELILELQKIETEQMENLEVDEVEIN
jgi:hypothetical protein